MKADFEALRAARNSAVEKVIERLAAELGVDVKALRTNYDPNACYCACTTGGPCEHQWDGEPYVSECGLSWSTTCSRCGCTSMSHDMRVAP